jgi:hypothetical protein
VLYPLSESILSWCPELHKALIIHHAFEYDVNTPFHHDDIVGTAIHPLIDERKWSPTCCSFRLSLEFDAQYHATAVESRAISMKDQLQSGQFRLRGSLSRPFPSAHRRNWKTIEIYYN